MASRKTESTTLLAGEVASPAITWRVLCKRAIVTNMILLSVLQMLDKADMKSTIAGMFRAMEQDFGINGDQEAVLLVVSALPTALFAPVWGILADSYPRFKLMLISAIIWGLTTFFSAFAPNYAVLVVTRGITAVALGAILPISQGIVADLVPPVYRGRMFGLLTVSGGAGAGAALLLATNFSQETYLGIRGWRVVLLLIAVLSLFAALLIAMLAIEPKRKGELPPVSCQSMNATVAYMSNLPTFILLVVQGLFGLVPWSAFSGFGPLWLQYSGLDRSQSTLALVCFGVGNGLGELLGGLLGDLAAQASPDMGRVRVAQVSVTLGIVVSILTFYVIPDAKANFGAIMPSLFLFGLTASWCGSGVKTPMLAEIVPQNMIVSAMGLAYGIEHASSAVFGSLVSGILAQHVFGFVPTRDDIKDMPEEQRAKNALALSSTMVWMMVIPWIICMFLWCFISFSYPKDRDRVLAEETERIRHEGAEGARRQPELEAAKEDDAGEEEPTFMQRFTDNLGFENARAETKSSASK